MARKSHADITDAIQEYLGNNSTDFTDALLINWITQGLTEFSYYCPNIVRETFATNGVSSSATKELDISEISDLLWVDALEFKVGKTPRQWRNFKQHYSTQLSMDIDFWPADADSGIDTDEALDSGEEAIDVDADATTAIPVGTIIRIENELYFVTATGTTLTVESAYGRTSNSAHATNKDIMIPQLAYLYCAKPHVIPALTDLAGVVDLPASGYAAGLRTIHIDTMGEADTLEEDWTFTITGDATTTHYRLTEPTILASNEGDITFEPGLAEAIVDGDVVTFDNSTLTSAQETLLIDLVAARAALSTSAKFIQTIPKSGRNPFADYMTFWQAQLSITLQKLQNEAKKYQKPYTEFPNSYPPIFTSA